MAMTQQEQDLFEKAGKKIREQQALLKRLTAPAYHLGTVVAVFPNRVVVDTGSQLFEMDKVESSLNVKIGQSVTIHPETGQIVKTSEYVTFGATGKVVAIDGDLIQVSTPSGVVTISYSMVDGVVVGDKVVLNSTNHVIMHRFPEQSQYAFKTQSVLNWSDIGAQEDAKKELIAALETPFEHEALYKFFNKQRIKGCLLWGRPGNGKTLLGRAAAGSIARMHGKESQESGFIYIKGPEILDKYVGETEQRIGEAFDYGVAHFKKHGYPAVLFIDEADAILIRRGMRTTSGMEQTIVPMFNARMDGIEDSGVFVILATNRADILDPAIVRPGRIDRKIYVAPPTKENAPSIFDIHMRNVPVAKGVSKEQLVTTTVESLYSDKFPLYFVETEHNGRSIFGLGSLVSGALIAGIVERASAIAIDRVLHERVADGMGYDELVKVSSDVDALRAVLGLTQPDFDNALTAMQKEQYGMNHFDELREFIENGKLDVKSIEQCHNGQTIATKPEEQRPQQEQVMVINVPKTDKSRLN
jgi:ATP-dependent 26S proteasome regulatory subunit